MMLSNTAIKMINYLKQHGFHKNKLHGRCLLSHLVCTYRLLLKWGNDEKVALVGLCHSLYERCEGYPQPGLPISERNFVANLVGHDVEQLAYLFMQAEYNHSITDNCKRKDYYLIRDFYAQKISINRVELKILLEVSAANMMEQMIYFKKIIPKVEVIGYLTPYLDAKQFVSQQGYTQIIDHLLSKNSP